MLKHTIAPIFLMLALMVPLFSYAQNPNYQWATPFEITDTEISDFEGGPISEVLIDRLGNTYMIGTYLEQVEFVPGQVIPGSPEEVYWWFLAKFNAQGQFEWSRIIHETATGYTDLFDLVLDSKDRVLVAGVTESDTTYLGDGKYLTRDCANSFRCVDLFLARYTPQGQLDWSAQLANQEGDIYDLQMKLDSKDNIYLSCLLYETESLQVGAQSLDGFATDALLTLKLNPQGALLWSKQGVIEGEHFEFLDVNAQNDGTFWVMGAYEAGEQLDIGDDYALLDFPDLEQFSAQSFLAKYAANGDVEWLSQFNGPELYTRMVCNKTGDVYIIGAYVDYLYYNGRLILSDIGLNPWPEEGPTAFILKLDQSGRILWKKQFPGVYPIAVDNIQESVGYPPRTWSVDAQGQLLTPLYFYRGEASELEIEGRKITFRLTYEDEDYPLYEWGSVVQIDRTGKLKWLFDLPMDSLSQFYPHLLRTGSDGSFYCMGAMYGESLQLGKHQILSPDGVSSLLTRFDFSKQQKRPSPADRPFPHPPAPIGESQLQVPLLDQVTAQLFPNPAQERLNIQLKQPISLESLQIRDQLGRMLWRSGGSTHFLGAEVDVKNLAPGVYVLELFTAQQKLNFQFIKK